MNRLSLRSFAHPAVEGLDVAVLHRSARCDVMPIHTMILRPAQHRVRGELGAGLPRMPMSIVNSRATRLPGARLGGKRLERVRRSLVEAKVNARWSLDFVHDQFAQGRRFRILNIVDDVTRVCLAAIPDTSISRTTAADQGQGSATFAGGAGWRDPANGCAARHRAADAIDSGSSCVMSCR